MIRETLEGSADVRGREITLGDSRHILEVNAFRITDEAGAVIGASFVFDDPHYEKNIERAARKSERLEFVNKIALRSSHELRNCLVSIRTFTQLLPEKYVDEQFRKDFYSVVSKEVERLNSLVDKLVFFAQPLTLQYGKVNVNELIDQSLSFVKGNEESTVTINKNFSHQVPFVEIDREQTVKAFGNIIQNAMQAMQKGGRLIISTKEAVQEAPGGRMLTVQFRDSGKGVALQNSDEVFEPFFSTKSRGLGLGLTIARKIIEEHGGTVRFDSNKEGGTEVTVFIPREPRRSHTLASGTMPQASNQSMG
jgi:nitrogen-specific signal transduction histidine kinase